MLTRIIALIGKEFVQFFRDRALVILVVYIFVEIALCGWALFLHVRNLPIAVYDLDRSRESRELVGKFAATDNFLIARHISNERELESLLDRGEVSMVLVVPAGFSRDLARRTPARVQLLVDGTNSQIAKVALGYAAGIIRSHSLNIELERAGLLDVSEAGIATVTNSIKALYDPDLEFTHFNMLSMVALAAFMTGLLLAAGAVVREKEAGTLEQLLVTPISSGELVVAKLLPMGVIKMAGLLLSVSIAIFVFHVPVKGSLTLFLGLSTLIFFAAMGVGVYLATLARNMQQVLLLSFFVLFPVMFLSGTLVPIENMPPVLQYLSYLNPLRYYMDIVLGIFLKGVGMEVLWPQTLALAVFSLAIISFGIMRFRKSLA
ncbi:MAG: ABC transporter permease [Blastocatellia bacterium]|nr:ABC transporter permease [Blastocatellia bacterium]